MVNRKWISDLVEPGKPGVLSQIYDFLMLMAIAIGTVPLLFRDYRPIFLYLDLLSILPSSIITAGYMEEMNRRMKEMEIKNQDTL